MDLEQAVNQSGVIPAHHVSSLLASLKRVPDYSWLLTPPHSTEDRLQGDLFADFPLAVIDEAGEARSTRFAVLVLNNTCDLQPDRSKWVTVAPTLDFGKFSSFEISKRGEQGAQGYLSAVRSNDIYEILWLPPVGEFTEGAVVFLDRVGSLSVKIYEDALIAGRRLASFSQSGFYFLLIKLTKHIARAETTEVTRYE